MNGKFLFDTNAIVYYLQGQPEWVDLINSTNMTERTASVITKIELLSYPGISKDEEERINRFLDDLTVVHLNEVIINNVISIRRATSTKLPDAVVAATALTLGATLITGDQRLKNLKWPGHQVLAPT
jgi:predicted nucleic acid-binding protein